MGCGNVHGPDYGGLGGLILVNIGLGVGWGMAGGCFGAVEG